MKRSLMMFGVALAAVAAVADGAVRRTHDGKIVIDGDKYAMNWILDPDGAQYDFLTPDCKWGTLRLPKSLDGKIADSLSRRQDGGDLVETLTISNLAGAPVVLEGASICFPFNDNYPDAKECVERRCNAHLWPFGSAAWACCMRMGGEGPHLGWMLTKGEVDGYEVNFRGRDRGSSNFRGVFSFRIPATTLAAGESLTLEWRLFSHAGWDDFFAQLEKRGSFVPHRDSYVIEDAVRPGERIERVEQGGKWTRVETLAISNFRDFIFRRLDFVLANQQYDAPGDIRDGAFLPYDNETGAQYKDWEQEKHRYDFDEGRERIGMGIAIAEAVRDHGYANPKAIPALEKYARFLRTALQDKNYRTVSEVLRPKHRIYNYAWVARFYFDMYDITGDRQYLEDGFRTAKAAYREGGYRFYLIEMPVRQSVDRLRKAGREDDAGSLLDDFAQMAENIMKYGLEVPKFEVNYEQSIIAPAANFLCEMYLVTKDEKYRQGVEALLPAVESFNGHQPSWHLNDVAIRHWDGYWFGKRANFGDTFPHYWSCITADFFGNWAEATGDRSYRRRASAICKANLGLFTEDGRGGAAYLYPDRLDGRPGRYLDPMANDQDWALVFASRWLEEYSGATLERDVAFVLEHAPKQDLPLDGNFVTNNCRLAAAARAAAIEKCPDDIYLDYVLPYSVIREEVDDWRGEFRERFLPLVEGCKDNYEAAVKLDRTIWDMIGVHYDTRRDKARQSPRHSMRIGMASCTGISIILIDACRAVGIPARLVGCCWTTIPGNHSWVEVWSGGRWRVLASGEKEREDDIWFLDYAAQADASRIDRRIYASRYSPSPSGTRFWRTWEYPHGVSDVPADDVTARYAKTGK